MTMVIQPGTERRGRVVPPTFEQAAVPNAIGIDAIEEAGLRTFGNKHPLVVASQASRYVGGQFVDQDAVARDQIFELMDQVKRSIAMTSVQGQPQLMPFRRLGSKRTCHGKTVASYAPMTTVGLGSLEIQDDLHRTPSAAARRQPLI